MIGRIVEIAEDGRRLSVAHGLMIVREECGEHLQVGQVPLDDIVALVANARTLSYTNSLLVALAERGVPFVVCAANHTVAGMLLSVDGHHEQARRIDGQRAAKLPLQKRLWSLLVQAKLRQQAATLETAERSGAPLRAMASRVRSGDPENLEAQGARKYWGMLFGPNFRRDRTLEGINALLNYGYTVTRAATARAVVAAGLHPSIGIHHSHDGNPLRLVDDLMEPFRALTDLCVWRLAQSGDLAVTATTKRALVSVLYEDVQTDAGVTPALVCVQKLATSLAQIYLGQRRTLDLPSPLVPVGVRNHIN